eukprot:TRINITY_DN14319_c0_g1_i1.p1 TRINITY_DN14319_c0_g1~~TRINITY_DN14319_c0_g1_i1.p1  ORF type:complete len:719 (+),score=70.12 TRINITY_DN14319_c0_g1_i1:29-2185(+)
MNMWGRLLLCLIGSIHVSTATMNVTAEYFSAKPPANMGLKRIRTAGSIVCAIGEGAYDVLSWSASSPSTWKHVRGPFSSQLNEHEYCSENFELESDGKTFTVYFKTCIRHIFTSTDCVTWKPVDNPIVYLSYATQMYVAAGPSSTLVRLYDDDNPAFVCTNDLLKCKAVDKTDFGDFYNIHIPPFWSGAVKGWLFSTDDTVFMISPMGKVSSIPVPKCPGNNNWEVTDLASDSTSVYWLGNDHPGDASGLTTLYTLEMGSMGWVVKHQFLSHFSNQFDGVLRFTEHTIGGTQEAIICSYDCNFYLSTPAMISVDHGNTFAFLNTTHDVLSGPLETASVGGKLFGINFKVDAEYDHDIVIENSMTPTAWQTVIRSEGPSSLEPLLSIKKGTMLWGVEKTKNACNSRIWTSMDGKKWTLSNYLPEMTIPNSQAMEYPPGSGQIVALIHSCDRDTGLSTRDGDLYYFSSPTGMPTLMTITPSINNYPGLFQAIGRGIHGDMVVAGAYSESTWYGYSTDGKTLHTSNITSTISHTCQFGDSFPLEIVGNGKAVLYNGAGSTTCVSKTTEPGPNFHFSDESRPFGQIRSQGQIFVGGSRLGINDMYYSLDGENWSPINRSPDFETCAGRALSGIGPAFGFFGNNMIVGSESDSMCWYTWDMMKPSQPLKGIKLPAVKGLPASVNGCSRYIDPSNGAIMSNGMGGWDVIVNTNCGGFVRYSIKM